jgi:hypothetical protein
MMRAWTKSNSSITANTIVAPDGTLTGDKLVEDTATAAHQLTVNLPFDYVSGTTYTLSCYIKAASRSKFQLAWRSDWFPSDNNLTADLSTGTISVGVNATGTITAVGNGWYRISVTSTADATGSSPSDLFMRLVSDAGSLTYTGDGTSGLYIWGAQLEVGSAVTPYIQSPSVFTSRASSGTYVGGNGLIQTAVTNLLLRSEELDNAYWTKSGATVSADQTASPIGTVTADKLIESAANSAHWAGRLSLGLPSAIYTCSIYAKAAERQSLSIFIDTSVTRRTAYFNVSNGTLGAISTGITSTIQNIGNGWYRCSITLDAAEGMSNAVYTAAIGDSNVYLGDGTSGIYIWGAQLEQASTVGEYIPTTSTINSAARYDHDPVSLIGKGLLLEEARTNLLRQSQDFTTTWLKSTALMSVTADAAVAPDGNTTADTLTKDASGFRFFYQGVTATAGATYSASVFLKAGTLNKATIIVSGDGGTTPDGRVVFDFAVKTATDFSSTGLVSASITEFPNGWFRCVVVATISSNTNPRVLIYPDTYSAAVAGSVYAWGAQLEVGAFATSYIPTTTATVTRAADISTSVATSVFESSWYRQDEGTVFANATTNARHAGANTFPRIASLSDGTTSNRMDLLYRVLAPYTDAGYNVISSNVSQAAFDTNNERNGQSMAMSYAANNFAFTVGGTLGNTDSSGTVPTVDRLSIGLRSGIDLRMSGTIRRLTYWPTRLGNEVLQRITQ